MKQVGVNCRFLANGRVQIQQVEINGRWLAVEQGRQWVSVNGRHVLIKLPGQLAQELMLQATTMTWILKPIGSPRVLA